MSRLEPRNLERMRYRQGQKLHSRDFRDLAVNEFHLRWWHNRALHRAYGIASGFAVEIHGNVLHVQPGVAYDAYGRELVLACEQRLAIPEAAETLVLIVRYQEPETPGCDSDSGEACWPGMAFPDAGIEFVWRVEHDSSGAGHVHHLHREHHGVLVARVPSRTQIEVSHLAAFIPNELARFAMHVGANEFVFPGVMSERVLEALLHFAQDTETRAAVRDVYRRTQPDYRRRASRPLARPRIVTGMTIPAATPWVVWLPVGGQAVITHLRQSRLLAAFQVTIDTAEAGFSATPSYFAQLEGPIAHLIRQWLAEHSSILHFHTHVAHPTPFEFVCRILISGDPFGNTDLRYLFRRLWMLPQDEPLYVSWIAVESNV
jgi:hypothetical protein